MQPVQITGIGSAVIIEQRGEDFSQTLHPVLFFRGKNGDFLPVETGADMTSLSAEVVYLIYLSLW